MGNITEDGADDSQARDETTLAIHSVSNQDRDVRQCGTHAHQEEGQNHRDGEDGETEMGWVRIDDASTEPATATNRPKVEEDEEGGVRQVVERASDPSSRPEKFITSVSERTSPSLSVTERQGPNHHPSWTPPFGDTFADSDDPPIDAHTEPVGEDEGYIESSTSSFATTVVSEVSRLVEENGRQYPNYGRFEYGLPVDERERERLALQHRL